jgi:tRNA-dihydrouridine synthase
LGWDDSINIDERWQSVCKMSVAALSIHARTRAQMYKVDWSHIARVKNNKITMPIFGKETLTALKKHYNIK